MAGDRWNRWGRWINLNKMIDSDYLQGGHETQPELAKRE